ncbi:hypothetical protein Gotri_016570 [Gossypium trilobum]|uniref:Uncharacterized protein n=1 Tax=Gossypium trilobum TaxID=34281 RepID=A0A7J9E3Y6_9ROSI|nr:hypothetical protein [Gossypium trilobum]
MLQLFKERGFWELFLGAGSFL